MENIRWESYPIAAQDQQARSWLQIQRNLQLAPNTIDAYGRSLNDYLAFCLKHQLFPLTVKREHIALYVQDLASRPHPKGTNIISLNSRAGLSNATMQQRITVARLYHDYLTETGLRPDNPIRRGHYVPGTSFSCRQEDLRERVDAPSS